MNEILGKSAASLEKIGEVTIDAIKELPKWFNREETTGFVDIFKKYDKPLHEIGKEGTEIHKLIQDKEIEKGNYSHKEIPIKNSIGEIVKREYEIKRGPKIGETKEQGSVYDLYKENSDSIKTAEIKPYTVSGIKAAKEKYELQKDIEDNYGGNKGKFLERETIFYNPKTKDIFKRFESNYNNFDKEQKKIVR